MNKLGSLFIVAIACLTSLPGCNNCEALESKICSDLGEEDCKIWKEAGGADGLSSGRRAGRACFNARFTPGAYAPHLQGAKAVVAGMKKAKVQQEAAAKRLQEKLKR